MKRFSDFSKSIKESKSEKDKSFDDFIKDIKSAVEHDFKNTPGQADEFVKLYKDELTECWENGFTTREAIASTKIPGVRLADDVVEESYIFEIDNDYEDLYETIKNMDDNKDFEFDELINAYFDKYRKKSFSDKRIFERVKNNFKSLKDLHSKKIKKS